MKNISFFIILIVIILLIFEGVLRVYNLNGRNYDIEMWKYSKILKKEAENPLIGIEQLPLKKTRLQNTYIQTNSAGFRDKEYEVPKPKDVYRIVFLGSSITFGWGVEEDKTYASLVEQQLSQEKFFGKRIEVINTSIVNYNTTREVESFFEKCLIFDPDMVILSFFLNDPLVLEIKQGNFLLRNFQIAVLLRSRFKQIARRLNLSEDPVNYYKGLYADNYPGWRQSQESMNRLMVYSKKHNIDVLLTMIPDIHNLQDYPFGEIHEIVERKALELGFSYLDFYEVLKDVMVEDIWAMPGDPHPNEKGHQIMANFLYVRLKSKLSRAQALDNM